MLQLFLAADIAGHGDGLAAGGDDLSHGSCAGVGVAARDHDLGAVLGHAFGAGQSQAATGASNDGNFAAKIKEGRSHDDSFVNLFAWRVERCSG
jgi:hypothetical protein